MNILKELYRGMVIENPTFCLVLGLCPTLAVTTSLENGVGMGLAASFVLLFSNMFISLLRNHFISIIRIPSYIVIIATFVTIASLFMQAYSPDLDKALGIYVPLIVVNCIIMARAEAYASKNSVVRSIIDAVGVGIGFTFALMLIGSIRELMGTGKIILFGRGLLSIPIEPALIFILAPGALLVMGILLAFFQNLNNKKIERQS